MSLALSTRQEMESSIKYSKSRMKVQFQEIVQNNWKWIVINIQAQDLNVAMSLTKVRSYFIIYEQPDHKKFELQTWIQLYYL